MLPQRYSSLVRAAAIATITLSAFERSFGQIVYEPFAYPAGPLDGRVNPGNGLPWDIMGSSGEDDIIVATGGLNNPSLAPSIGGSATWAGSGKSERLSLGSSIASGTVYYSMLLQVNALDGMTTSPSFIAGFSNRSGTSDIQPTTLGTRLYVRESSASTPADPRFNIGVSKNSNTLSDIAFDSTNYTLNTPITVVGAYRINGSNLGTDDAATLYINPTGLGGAIPPAGGSAILNAPAAGTDLFDFDTARPAVAAFVLRQGIGVPGVQVDEVRVDTTWAQVTQVPGTSWTFSGNGTWSEGGKWSGGIAPNDVDAFINLPSVGGVPHTITMGAPASLRTLTITSPQAYTINGSQTLSFSDAAAINVRAGSHTITAPVTLGGRFLASVGAGSNLTTSGAFNATGRAVSKAGAGNWTLNTLRAASLDLHGGRLTIAPSGATAATSRLETIEVSPVGRLDLSDNNLVVTTTPIGAWNGQAYSGVTGLVASGRNNGAWNGPGIVTSDPRATGGLVSLGVVTASNALGIPASSTAVWSGHTVSGTDTLVKFTYGGDANLDGRVNIDDYGRIDANISASGSVFGWYNGDFNYDGKINIDDYGIIDANVTRQASPLGTPVEASAMMEAQAPSSVPEPGALAALLVGGLFLRRGRRGG